MEKLRKLMEKKMKEHGKMSENEMNAKHHVLENIRDLAHSAMADKLKGMKKVSVAAPDQEGLAHGLDMAKNLVQGQSDEDGYAHGGLVAKDADELQIGKPIEGEDEAEIDDPDQEDREGEENGYASGGRVQDDGGDIGNSTADELEDEEDDGLISRHGGGSEHVDAGEESENDDRDERSAQDEDEEHDELDKQIQALMAKKNSLKRK